MLGGEEVELKSERIMIAIEPSLLQRVKVVSEATGVSVAQWARVGLSMAIRDIELVLEGSNSDA